MKNLGLLLLLAAGCLVGWWYFSAEPPPPPAPEATPPPLEIPFSLELKVQRLIEAYEDDLVRQGGAPLPAKAVDRIRRDLASIQRDLQRLKIYDLASMRTYCLEAANRIDTNGDGRPDYAPEQARHLVDAIIGHAGTL